MATDFHFLKLGPEAESKTGELYENACREINIFTRGMSYSRRVLDSLWKAARAEKVKLNIIFPSKSLLLEELKQEKIDEQYRRDAVQNVTDSLRVLGALPEYALDEKKVEILFLQSREHQKEPLLKDYMMWMHGSIVDPPILEKDKCIWAPPRERTSCAAILTTHWPDPTVPPEKRFAILTYDPRFVMSMRLLFGLLLRNSEPKNDY